MQLNKFADEFAMSFTDEVLLIVLNTFFFKINPVMDLR